MVATDMAGNPPLVSAEDPRFDALVGVPVEVYQPLAKQIVKGCDWPVRGLLRRF